MLLYNQEDCEQLCLDDMFQGLINQLFTDDTDSAYLTFTTVNGSSIRFYIEIREMKRGDN